MNTKIKRIFTGAMAGAMALSMSATALAAAPDTVITARYEAIPIKVTVTPTGDALINPYGLAVEFAEKVGSEVKEISGEQITTSPLYITNNGKTKLKVGASVIGEARGNFKFAADADTITGKGSEGDAGYVAPSTYNSAFVYLQLQSAGDLSTDADAEDEDATYDAVLGAISAADYWEEFDVDTCPVVGLKATKAENMLTLAAATLNADGEVTAYPDGSIAAFHLGGEVVKEPKLGWAAEDGFVANVAFTFAPDLT